MPGLRRQCSTGSDRRGGGDPGRDAGGRGDWLGGTIGDEGGAQNDSGLPCSGTRGEQQMWGRIPPEAAAPGERTWGGGAGGVRSLGMVVAKAGTEAITVRSEALEAYKDKMTSHGQGDPLPSISGCAPCAPWTAPPPLPLRSSSVRAPGGLALGPGATCSPARPMAAWPCGTSPPQWTASARPLVLPAPPQCYPRTP